MDPSDGFRYLPGRTLKPLLAITFATTTPLGIGIGLATLGAGSRKGPHLILVQGIMSAVSAGMLIYAACVEMLAGDFVMDAHLWRSSVRRQVVALGSLVAGVCAMAAIGCVHVSMRVVDAVLTEIVRCAGAAGRGCVACECFSCASVRRELS